MTNQFQLQKSIENGGTSVVVTLPWLPSQLHVATGKVSITHAYILAATLFRERRFVLLVSDTETQAVNFLNDLKAELKENDDLINLFGVNSFLKDTETDIIVKMEDGYTFRIFVRGSEQKVRGLKWNQLRPDLIVCDDLENEELVYNKDRREKFKKWFDGALLPSRSSNGIVRVVGTVLHMDSFLNNLMPAESSKYTVKEELKDYSTNKLAAWRSVRYRAHNEDFSQILWPGRYDKKWFVKTKSYYDDQGNQDLYSQEYLNYPLDENKAYFKRSDFREMHELDYLSNKLFYIGMDLAVSTESRRDYSVFAIVGVDPEGLLHLVEVRRGRWDSVEIIEELFRIEEEYKPEHIFCEKGTIEKSLKPIINREMISKGIYMNFHTFPAITDKMTRGRALQKIVKSGGMKFDKKAEWYGDLEDELSRFPRGRHDDQVDALAWFGHGYNYIRESLTLEEQEEEDWQDEFYNDKAVGRSQITGY